MVSENKRFTILSSYLGMYIIFDEKEGKPLTAHEVVELLNKLLSEKKELTEELQTIKNTIKTMYENERTDLGHNVLAQLIEAIQ